MDKNKLNIPDSLKHLTETQGKPIMGVNSVKNFERDIGRNMAALNDFQRLKEEKSEEQRMKEFSLQQEQLEILKSIEKNTGDISHIVLLLQQNTSIQDEILDAMKHILEIGKANSIEEADDLYRKAMDKANELNKDVETATALIGYAKVVWTIIKSKIGMD